MSKIAQPDYPIHEIIKQRWSPRAFSPREVEREKLLSLLEAARWAPSSYNEQPWRYFVATREHPEHYEKLFGCLGEGNRKWAGNAPVLMLSVAKTFFDKNQRGNRHAWHDVGLATANLIFQATDLGLHVHQMAGFHVEKVRRVLRIPQGFEPAAMIAVGYLGDPESLEDEKLRARETAPRTRKPLKEIVFANTWGQAAPLVAGQQ